MFRADAVIEPPGWAHCTISAVQPRRYDDFDLEAGKPIYTQFREHPEMLSFVPRPARTIKKDGGSLWTAFEP